MMQVVSEFLLKAKGLSKRMRSPERMTLSTADIHLTQGAVTTTRRGGSDSFEQRA